MLPAKRLRVSSVTGFVAGQDRPDRVKLAVLAEEVRAAEPVGREIPDSHVASVLATPSSSATLASPSRLGQLEDPLRVAVADQLAVAIADRRGVEDFGVRAGVQVGQRLVYER